MHCSGSRRENIPTLMYGCRPHILTCCSLRSGKPAPTGFSRGPVTGRGTSSCTTAYGCGSTCTSTNGLRTDRCTTDPRWMALSFRPKHSPVTVRSPGLRCVASRPSGRCAAIRDTRLVMSIATMSHCCAGSSASPCLRVSSRSRNMCPSTRRRRGVRTRSRLVPVHRTPSCGGRRTGPANGCGLLSAPWASGPALKTSGAVVPLRRELVAPSHGRDQRVGDGRDRGGVPRDHASRRRGPARQVLGAGLCSSFAHDGRRCDRSRSPSASAPPAARPRHSCHVRQLPPVRTGADLAGESAWACAVRGSCAQPDVRLDEGR